jgi:hypothetical protein
MTKFHTPYSRRTPGPWQRTPAGGTVHPFQISSAVGNRSIVANCTALGFRTTEANAHLIAAAPELLETLRDVEANLTGQDYFPERVADSLRRIKAAIAKAEGEAPDEGRGR